MEEVKSRRHTMTDEEVEARIVKEQRLYKAFYESVVARLEG